MVKFFKRLFGIPETNLDNILSSFKRTLTDLEGNILHHATVAEEQGEAAAEALRLQTFHETQADKAHEVRGRLSALVEGPT